MATVATLGLETYLLSSARADPSRVCRDRKGRLLLVREDALDMAKLRTDGTALRTISQRIRFMDAAESWLAPRELLDISQESGADNRKAADKVETPLGTLDVQRGLWLKYAPGIEYVGRSDRGEILLRRRSDRDPSKGSVENSANTRITGRAKRLVTRLDETSYRQDVAEAEAWLQAFEALAPGSVRESRFLCAGISYVQRGNVEYLTRTAQVNFFPLDDPEAQGLAKEVQARFQKIGRKRAPSVRVLSLIDVPEHEAAFAAFREKLRAKRGDATGLPSKLADSAFFDKQDQRVTPANFVRFSALQETPDEVTIVTVNTDYHGEVKSRGVLSPLMAIMSLIDVISAHAGAGVLNRNGLATLFTGPTGTGKTTATSFFAERNETYRREELARRYRRLLAKEGLSGSALDRREKELMQGVGILCQEDWVEILGTENGWRFWPTERALYARTGGFPGLKFILFENKPLVENAYADFGASGRLENVGAVTHDYFPARLFYQPEWGHLLYDRSPRRIAANVFLERNSALGFMVRRVGTEEALRWLLIGRTPDGSFEPLYNAYPDFSGLLITLGVVGEELVSAYESARGGDVSRLAKGDAVLGQRIFDKLDRQMKLWRQFMDATPTFIVNGAPGLEITQDANWLVSEMPEVVGPPGSELSVEKFKEFMARELGVTYGPRGEWTHVKRW